MVLGEAALDRCCATGLSVKLLLGYAWESLLWGNTGLAGFCSSATQEGLEKLFTVGVMLVILH